MLCVKSDALTVTCLWSQKLKSQGKENRDNLGAAFITIVGNFMCMWRKARQDKILKLMQIETGEGVGG